MIIRSIDLGYGFVKFVTARTHDTMVCAKFRALAPLASGRHLSSTERARDTVLVDVDGLCYEVGREAHLVQRAHAVPIAHGDYIQTPQYLALLRGALSYIGLPHIDTLVVGLPVEAMPRAQELIARIRGVHRMPGGAHVDVTRTIVLAQPVGGYYSCGQGSASTVTLVVDPGYYTVDWVVMRGRRALVERSGSHPGGMYDVLTTVADGISQTLGRPYRNLDAIDDALVHGTGLRIAGETVDLSPHMGRAQSRVREGVAALSASVGDGLDIDRIVLVGGGAQFYQAALQERFGAQIEIPSEPEYANVRGFQRLGEQLGAN